MFYTFIFLLGLCVGSFLNVVICRLETKESIVFGRSHCPQCGAVLKWHQLIPVLSFLLQKGKCRYCGKKISWQYPAVETATGLLFVFVILNQPLVIPNLIGNPDYINIHWIPAFAGMTFNLLITCLLIIIFVYDLKHYIIPDKIVYPAILVSGIWLLLGVLPLGRDPGLALKGGLLSAFLASAFFLGLVLVSKGKWMGLGDVKLAFLMGLVLGWPNILFALLLAFFSGAIIGLMLIIFNKKGFKSEIPFGPFLAGATILVMFTGQHVDNLFAFKLVFW